MPLHIRKLCVGEESVETLIDWQQHLMKERGGRIWHTTRNWPRRQKEVLDGGSLYWIIKKQMSVRQRIIGFEPAPVDNPDEKPQCRIILDPKLVRTVPWPHRAFQGWRYLEPSEAPPDIDETTGGEDLPAPLMQELRALGLW